MDADVRTRALPEGREPFGNGGKRRAVGVEFGVARAARKTRLMHAGRIEVEAKDVGLERLETAFLDMPAELDHVVERAHRLEAHHFSVAEAVAAAMRPIQRQPI